MGYNLVMPYFGTRKNKGFTPYKRKRKSGQTGEDFDMLHENEIDPEHGRYGSEKYKDHEDGA